MRVGVVAPSPALRAGLRAMLTRASAGDRPGIEVVFETGSLEGDGDALPGVDVVLFAQRAAQTIGLQTAVLLLTADAEDAIGLLDLPARGWGVLSPDCTEDELRAAVQALALGLSVGDATWVQALLEVRREKPARPAEGGERLTARELQVLQLLGRGQANKQIAAALGISEHTVKFHLSAIFGKLNAANRAEAVRIGIQQGMIPV